MTYLGILLAAALATAGHAHDEGHGPKLTDVPPQGGVVTAVVELKDAKLGPKAALVYKAELVRSEDGTVRVTLYDKDLKAVDVSRFDKAARGSVETVRRKKVTIKKFPLTLEGANWVGKMPKPGSKPFNLDFVVAEGKRKLLAAFENLD